MLNTQEAWDMFNELERVYFAYKGELIEQPNDIQSQINELKYDIADLKKCFEQLKQDIAISEQAYDAIIKEMQKNISPAERADKLITLTDKVQDTAAKDKVLLCAANLLVGKNIF